MHCICHNNSILNLNPKTQTRRGLIKYNTTNDIITLRKHVNVGPIFIYFLNLKKWTILWNSRKEKLQKKD